MSPPNLLQGLSLKARGLKTKWALVSYLRGGPQRWGSWASPKGPVDVGSCPREEGTVSAFLSCFFGQVSPQAHEGRGNGVLPVGSYQEVRGMTLANS